eukprot:COSAG01_NODE_13469_length_1581_cov_65.683536_2_plen_231_part_00
MVSSVCHQPSLLCIIYGRLARDSRPCTPAGVSWNACSGLRNDPCSCKTCPNGRQPPPSKCSEPTFFKSVTCRQQHIQKLQLPLNNLTGTLSSSIANFSGLTWLGLYKNHLHGPLPPELGKLSGLETLALEDNMFSGTLPAEIGQLSRLTFLDVHGNRFEGLVPALPFAQYTQFCSFNEPDGVGSSNKFRCPLPNTCRQVERQQMNATDDPCPACNSPRGGGIGPHCTRTQ